MEGEDGRVERLARELRGLADRVGRLEAALSGTGRSGDGGALGEAVPGGEADVVVGPGELDVELLGRLRGRSGEPFERGEERGAVLYAGSARLGGGSYVWQVERPVPGLMGVDDGLLAKVLSAVASPPRLRLIKALVRGARGTRRLQEALGGVSTGQLYHHLKELQAVGLVAQKGRGDYEVAAHAVVPLLAIIAAVYDLADVGQYQDGGWRDLPLGADDEKGSA